jgi:hypothetical protein
MAWFRGSRCRLTSITVVISSSARPSWEVSNWRWPPLGLVRAFFAENGRPGDPLASLEVARQQAVEAQGDLAAMARACLDGEAPFPERTAMGALAMRFVVDFHRLLEEWSIWASSEVATWEHPDGRDWDGALAVMVDVADRTPPRGRLPA